MAKTKSEVVKMAQSVLDSNLYNKAWRGDWTEVEKLMAEGGALDWISGWDCCALQLMTSAGRDLRIIPENKNINVNYRSRREQPSLHSAVKNYTEQKGNLENVRWLLKHGADPELEHMYDNKTVLDVIDLGNATMIDLLVTFGATKWNHGQDDTRDKVLQDVINQADIYSDNKLKSFLEEKVISDERLQWLAKEDDLSMVSSYDYCVPLDVVDSDGNSLLHLAVANTKLNNVRYLLEQGCLVNPQNKAGDSSLHTAVRLNNTSMSQLLITNSADVNLANNKGETPLHFCRNSSLLKSLIANNGKTEAITDYGETTLMKAIRWEDEDSVRILLEQKHDIDAQNNFGCTALHMSITRGIDLVRLLLREQPDVSLKNVVGETVLHVAARRFSVEIVEVLLTSGADPNCKSKRMETPLDVARSFSVMQALVLRGATDWSKQNARKDQRIKKFIAEKKPALEVGTGKKSKESRDAKSDNYKCKICYQHPVDTLLQPCLHLCLCEKCSPKVQTCPVCRDTPHAKIRLHIP